MNYSYIPALLEDASFRNSERLIIKTDFVLEVIQENIIKKPTIYHNNPQLDSDTIDPNICPLCNKSNNCGNVFSCDSNQGCWCSDQAIQFSEALLKKIPSTAKNKACICRACALLHD